MALIGAMFVGVNLFLFLTILVLSTWMFRRTHGR